MSLPPVTITGSTRSARSWRAGWPLSASRKSRSSFRDGRRIRLLSVLGRDDGTLARVEVTGDTPDAAAAAVLERLRAES